MLYGIEYKQDKKRNCNILQDELILQIQLDKDIDITFFTDKDVDSYECFMKEQELAGIFNREVDLINLNTSSTVFKAQVVGTGKKLVTTK